MTLMFIQLIGTITYNLRKHFVTLLNHSWQNFYKFQMKWVQMEAIISQDSRHIAKTQLVNSIYEDAWHMSHINIYIFALWMMNFMWHIHFLSDNMRCMYLMCSRALWRDIDDTAKIMSVDEFRQKWKLLDFIFRYLERVNHLYVCDILYDHIFGFNQSTKNLCTSIIWEMCSNVHAIC